MVLTILVKKQLISIDNDTYVFMGSVFLKIEFRILNDLFSRGFRASLFCSFSYTWYSVKLSWKIERSIGRDDDNFLSALFTFCNCVVENRSYRGLLNYMRVGFVLHVDSSK
jgi:hypothetical protein